MVNFQTLRFTTSGGVRVINFAPFFRPVGAMLKSFPTWFRAFFPPLTRWFFVSSSYWFIELSARAVIDQNN